MTRSELKAKAKAQLGHKLFGTNWLLALVVLLIGDAITGVCAALSSIGIGAVASLIITGPLNVGIAFCFLKQMRDGQPMSVEHMFRGFSSGESGSLGDNILLGLLMSIFVTLWSLLFLIPGIVKSYAYSMAFYIKNDHPEYDWRACINESRSMMNGHKGELFVLDLSFIGWYIVGFLCLGVGTLWVAPYYQATRAQFYESLRSAAAAAPAEPTVVI